MTSCLAVIQNRSETLTINNASKPRFYDDEKCSLSEFITRVPELDKLAVYVRVIAIELRQPFLASRLPPLVLKSTVNSIREIVSAI